MISPQTFPKVFLSLRRSLPRLLSALTLLAVFLAAVPAPAQAAAPTAPCQGAECIEIQYNPYSHYCMAIHVVKAGETLGSIARRYHVPVRAIMLFNGITGGYKLEAGDILCIPPEGDYTFYNDCYNSNASFEAYTIGKRVYIDGTDFPRNNTYYVRIAPYKTNSWKHLGVVTASRRGNISASFKIPSSMRKYPLLTVCLKNAENDRLYCTGVINY